MNYYFTLIHIKKTSISFKRKSNSVCINNVNNKNSNKMADNPIKLAGNDANSSLSSITFFL